MATNVTKQTIDVGFETPNRKTGNIGQLQNVRYVFFSGNTVNTLIATTSGNRPLRRYIKDSFASQSNKCTFFLNLLFQSLSTLTQT